MRLETCGHKLRDAWHVAERDPEVDRGEPAFQVFAVALDQAAGDNNLLVRVFPLELERFLA